MPVQSDYVPLGTAKTWAKRLAHSIKSLTPDNPWPLSRCQLAVAKMLGYEHWHALNQSLAEAPNPPAEEVHIRDIDQSPFRGDIKLPSQLSQWPDFWRELLDLEGQGGVVCLERRGDNITLKRNVHGKWTTFATLPTEIVIEGLTTIAQPSMREAFRQVMIPGIPKVDYTSFGAWTTLDLSNRHGASPTITLCPIYPDNGLDILIQARCAATAQKKLGGLNLPKDLVAKLRSLCSFEHGMFFFSGISSSQKETLMACVINDRTENHGNRAPLKIQSYERIPSHAINGADVYKMEWSIPLNEVNTRMHAGGTAQRIPDIIVIDEMQDTFHGDACTNAVRSGAAFFGTCHNGSVALLPERLMDFDVPEEQLPFLKGWAYVNLLALLCPHCSTTIERLGTQRQKGAGCGRCHGMGFVGQQMIVDLWESNKGVYTRLFSHNDQARDLIRRGLVDLEDAQGKLGGLAL